MASLQRKVYLGPLLDPDVHKLFAWINDRETVLLNAPFALVHFKTHTEWFDAVRQRADTAIFAIRAIDGDRLVGSCQLHSIHPVHRSAELQIRIGDAKDRGKGYGREALKSLLHHGFADRNLNRIQLHVFSDNLAAIRLYTRAGFQEEGRLRQAAFIDGTFKDVVVMSLVRSELAAE